MSQQTNVQSQHLGESQMEYQRTRVSIITLALLFASCGLFGVWNMWSLPNTSLWNRFGAILFLILMAGLGGCFVSCYLAGATVH